MSGSGGGSGGGSDRTRVEAVFEAALELVEAERAAFVERACGTDAAMRGAVQALLAAHERASGVLERDPRGLFDPAASPERDPRGLYPGAAPERLGAYRVQREIGRGGMGVVYDAERDDGQFRRRVAIKIIQAGNNLELQRRVLAERQILAALDHPHIARLLDGGVADDGRPFLVMEYVDGMPVDVYCDRMRLSVAERLRLFVTIARAVDFAHRNLVVHRDLKPSNVLVTPDGGVKLLDFGVAKLLNPWLPGLSGPVTRDRAALTPEYASPEQIRGDALTTTTDVYSLGVMLYELLTGSRPFAEHEQDVASLMNAVCNMEPQRPSARVRGATDIARDRNATTQRLVRQLAGDCDAIVALTLRNEPQRRYSSAELLAQDIERHLSARPVLAHRGSRGYALRKMVQRNRPQAAALLLGTMAVLTGAGVAAWQAAAAHRERDRAEIALAQSEQVTEFLLDLFESGDPTAEMAGTVTARDLVRRGAARINDLAAQPLLQARMLAVLGRIHESLAEYDEAQRLTQRSLTIRDGLRIGDEPESADLMLQLGILQRRRGEYDSAQASFTEARRILEQAPGGPHASLGPVMQQLSSIAIYRGDLAEAERRAVEAMAVQIRHFGEEDRASVNMLRYLGAVQWRRGDYEQAERTLRRAIELRPAAVSSTRHEAIHDRMQLAELLVTVGRDAEANVILLEVERGLRETEPDDASYHVWTRASRSGIVERRGDRDLAVQLRREVLARRQNTYGDYHPAVALDKTYLGLVLARHQQFEEATQLLDEAGAVALQVYGEHSTGYAGHLASLAALRMAQARFHEADSLLSRSLRLQDERGTRMHMLYVERLQLLADVRIALRDYDSAEILLNEALETATRLAAPTSMHIRDIHTAFTRLHSAAGRPADAERHRLLSLPG
ncbi:hypothetical protein BH23GEM9_BH23GEM9_17340 [soil metagenome]